MRDLRAGASGFSLIETVLAIAVIAVTFIGLIGLLGLGAANDQTSSQQTVANNIAASILADLRSAPVYSTTTTRFGLTLPTAPANATTPVSASATPLTGTGVTTKYLYFDNSPSLLPLGSPAVYTGAQSPVPSGAAYVAVVYLTRIGYLGPTATSALTQSNDMVRVVVSWPAQTTTTPAGTIDVISQFLIH